LTLALGSRDSLRALYPARISRLEEARSHPKPARSKIAINFLRVWSRELLDLLKNL
jgi:hypothetical protein